LKLTEGIALGNVKTYVRINIHKQKQLKGIVPPKKESFTDPQRHTFFHGTPKNVLLGTFVISPHTNGGFLLTSTT